MKTTFEDVFPADATSLEEYLQQVGLSLYILITCMIIDIPKYFLHFIMYLWVHVSMQIEICYARTIICFLLFGIHVNLRAIYPIDTYHANYNSWNLLQVHEMAMVSAIQEAQKDNLRSFNDYMLKVLEVSIPCFIWSGVPFSTLNCVWFLFHP